jgi:hypothetical protein
MFFGWNGYSTRIQNDVRRSPKHLGFSGCRQLTVLSAGGHGRIGGLAMLWLLPTTYWVNA